MIEVTGLDQVVADLTASSVSAVPRARAVVQKGALNVKQDAQRFSSGLRHAPLYPASITYETMVKRFGIEGIIGPDKDRPQGALGNLLEYGSANNAPLAHLGPALDLEGPRFVESMGQVSDL